MSDTKAPGFEGPMDIKHNRGLIADPAAFAQEAGAASWLYLSGEEFAATGGGCRMPTCGPPSPSP